MIKATYYATNKQTHQPVPGETLLEYQASTSDWLTGMPPPTHELPLELWSPIQGDNAHIVHITGMVKFWHGDSHLIGGLVRFLQDDAQLARFNALRATCPDDTHEYVLRVEQRQVKRVPRDHPEFMRALEELVSTPETPND